MASGCSMLMSRIVQFILYGSKELTREIGIRIVVDTCDEDVRHLLIQVALAAADVTDALQQLPEIATTVTLQSFIIQHESLLYKLTQMCCSPLTESRSHLRLHPIAHGYNHVQIVVAYLSSDAAITLLSN